LRLPVRVTALINDTVGTLLARAYAAPKSATTIMGAVFGTGTNGAYIEQASRIKKLGECVIENERVMIINSEWGNFDQNLEYLPVTTFDKTVDAQSVNPGFEMFEKMVSGMYLGEILRLAFVSLLEDSRMNILEQTDIQAKSRLYESWSVDTSVLSSLQADNSLDLSVSRIRLEQTLGLEMVSYEVVRALRTIACSIGRRAARLGAVALGAVILQTDSLGRSSNSAGRVDIGVDGSLIELYPPFANEMRRALSCIEGIGLDGLTRIDIAIAKDGSGVGAALAAYIA
ncbi:hexokinase, partial [Setomelanomma holmii]